MRTPHFGITAKLFAALLAITLAVVTLLTLATQVAFRGDFLDYVRDRQRERAEALAGRLGVYYAERGGWAGLRSEERWRHLLGELLWRDRDDDEAQWALEEDEELEADDDDAGEAHELDDEHRHTGPRGQGPALLDASRRRVAGPAIEPATTELVPVSAGGRTVGYVAFRPAQGPGDRLAERFQREQLQAAVLIALVMAVLAAGASLLLARGFLAPLQRLTEGTRALAAGRFDVRVTEARRDELGQLARDFNRLAETLERNEQLRRSFMADMSHELRTPLSVLRAELEALEDGVRPLTIDAVAGLQRNLNTLSKLVDDLYELSLADAGALNYRMAPLALDEVTASCAEQWRPRLAGEGLALRMQPAAERLTVEGDRRRLEQLFGNLLENSLRYTDAGGTVRLTVYREGREAVVTLEDSSPGVPEAALARVFERLYRVEGSRSRDSGGAGLGLAICRNIVEAHGGRIRAYAAAEGGLGVVVALPLARWSRDMETE